MQESSAHVPSVSPAVVKRALAAGADRRGAVWLPGGLAIAHILAAGIIGPLARPMPFSMLLGMGIGSVFTTFFNARAVSRARRLRDDEIFLLWFFGVWVALAALPALGGGVGYLLFSSSPPAEAWDWD